MEVLKGELNSTSTYVPAQLTKDQLLVHHINTLTKINVKIDKCELPTFYCLPKLHKRPYKSRFISNSSHCSTTILSKHITSALTAVEDHVMKYSETAFSNSNVNYFWSIKNSSEVIEKLRLRNFQGSQVSSFDFSTLYTSLPHDLIKAKVLSLVNCCFNRESKSYLCTSLKAGFFSNKKYDSYRCWSCAELCEAFTFPMENIYMQFDGMVYQQIVIENTRHLIFECANVQNIWKILGVIINFDIQWKHVVIGFCLESNEKVSILNNIMSFIACRIYKFKMFCRLESIDETEYAIRYNLRKQLLFNYNVLKLRKLENHANYYYQIAELL